MNRKLYAILMGLALAVPALAACDPESQAGKHIGYEGPDDAKKYSYRMGPSDLPTSWNIHTYQSNSSTYVLDYTSDSLYTFDYNEDFTGYQIVPSMASDFPEDVTADYVGKFGITAEDENKAWAIPLKKNLLFDNGAKITAETFEESMKLLLNPQAKNFRADNVYASGDLKITGAEGYLKQGSTTFGDVTEGAGAGWAAHPEVKFVSEGLTCDLSTATELKAAIAVPENLQTELVFKNTTDTFVGSWAAGQGYIPAYGDTWAEVFENGFGAPGCVAAAALLEGKTLKQILADDSLCEALLLINSVWQSEEGEEFGYFAKQVSWPEVSYEDSVGFFADKKGRLVVVLKNAMELNFYLKYELCTSFFLVEPETYKACESVSQGIYNNTYGTSKETYVGYGPYKLDKYVQDNQIELVRNTSWHGYTRGEYKEGTYQTNHVVYKKVTSEATRLEMFTKGELDSYSLQPEDMDKYLGSRYTVYTDTESTWYLAMNPQVANLKTVEATATPGDAFQGYDVIKTPLAITEFRQGLSYSLDRAQFNLSLSPTSGIAKALLSSMIIADPETGKSYRSLDVAKDAILEFWGLADEWGAGKTYATRDEAIASITGYDLAGAKELFRAAYTKAIEEEYLTQAQIDSGKWCVQIVIGRPSQGNYYTKGYEFLKANWIEAVKGTPWEGHLDFVQSQVLGSTTFGDYLRDGSVDILFGVGYGGSMFNPFSMMDCFTGSLQYDVFTDMKSVQQDIKIGDKTYRASLYAWCSECINGVEITANVVDASGNLTGETAKLKYDSSSNQEERIAIMAKIETAIMKIANIFPIQTDASASLRCMRIAFKTEDYVLGMGFGGVQYYTYSMDDDAFVAYAASQPGGVLDYTVSEE